MKYKQYKPNLKYRYPTFELKNICALHVVKINRLIAKRNYDDRIEYSFFPLYNYHALNAGKNVKKSNIYLRQIIVEFQNRNLKENDDAFL